MNSKQLAALRKLAAAATQGPYRTTGPSSVVGCALSAQPDPKKNTQVLGSIFSPTNAAYFAALEPSVIIDLLDALATARGELAEQEAEKLALVNEIEAYKLVHQGMQTKWHAILRQVIAPLPEFEEAVKSGKAMQRAGFTPAASILNCQKDCAVCAATLAPAPPQEGEAAEGLTDACAECAYRQPEDAEQPCPRCGNGIYVAMTDAQAHQIAKKWASAAPLEGKAAPTYEEYLAAAEKSGMPSPASRETWSRIEPAAQRQLIAHTKQWTQPVDAEGKPLEFREGGYWNE